MNEKIVKVMKKVVINLFMAIVMITIGMALTLAALDNGMKISMPKIEIEHYDLQLNVADSDPLAREVATK